MTLTQTLFGFRGRLPRLRWFVCSFALGVATAAAWGGAFAVGYAMERNGSEGGGQFVAGLLAGLWGIALVWVSLALNAKRLHDLGQSGWHLLWINAVNVVAQLTVSSAPAVAMLCGLFGVAVMLVFLFRKGTSGPNAFGDDPVPAMGGPVSLAKA